MPTRVLLVRHGQSEWNAAGRWQGQADPPLTEVGRRQAGPPPPSSAPSTPWCASDLQRASETAMIIAGEIGVGPVVLEPGLRERDAGEWSGLTRAEIDRDWPGYLDPPAGRARVVRAVGRAVARAAAAVVGTRRLGAEPGRWRCWTGSTREVGDGDVLAVTHGGLIYVLEGHLGGPGRPDRPTWPGGGLRSTAIGCVLGDRVLLRRTRRR